MDVIILIAVILLGILLAARGKNTCDAKKTRTVTKEKDWSAAIFDDYPDSGDEDDADDPYASEKKKDWPDNLLDALFED